MIWEYRMQTAVQTSILVAALTISVAAIWYLKGRKKTYVKVGKIAKIFFFPVKSLKGIEVNKAECLYNGIQVYDLIDRSYMLITEDARLLSQRQEPSLTFLTPSICGNQLQISGPEMDTLKIDLNSTPTIRKIINVRIHADGAFAVDCGDEPSKWFQKFLKRSDVRLVRCSWDLPKRKYLQKNPLMTKLKKTTNIGFQDFAPVHLMSQGSVDDLNSKLQEQKISVKNFRPNILVEGCKSYEEDQWRYLKFSSGAELVHLSPCGRCILTTNDPETGVKTNKEPLVTLKKYRMPADEEMRVAMGSSPLLGVHFSLSKKGSIAVGDDIYAVVEQGLIKF